MIEIVRDLTWAVEELQFRRLQDRRETAAAEKPRPYLLFGSDEAVLKFVEDNHLEDSEWKQAGWEDLDHVLPRSVRPMRLDGSEEGMWKKWEELCRTYDAKPEGNA